MKRLPQDDVLEVPGFTMKRSGRAIEIQTHRTPEEQARLLKTIWESRPAMLTRIREASEELANLIRKYTSFDLVANLMLRHVFFDADEYKETDSTKRPHFVEHAAMLQLREPTYQLTQQLYVPAVDLQRAEALLTEIFHLTVRYYGAEAADPARGGAVPSPLDELRRKTIIREMMVGPPAYPQHWKAILEGLFGGTQLDTDLNETLGFDLKAAISCAITIGILIREALAGRRRRALQSQEDIKRQLKHYIETGKFEGRAEDKEIFDVLRNRRSKERKHLISRIAAQWVAVPLSDLLSFAPAVLASKAHVSEEITVRFLQTFSLPFGSTPPDYAIPGPVPAVRLRPIAKLNGKYFCPLPGNLIWAIKPKFEQSLKASSRWDSYQKHRSNFLVCEGLKALKKLLRAAEVHQNLAYPIASGKQAELDGLVLFDRYAILLEAKAGDFGDARRGGPDRIKRNLAQLVGDPSEQGARAWDYIRKNEKPLFTTLGKNKVVIDKAYHTEIALITLTLDSLDVYTPELNSLLGTGLLGAHDIPWAVCLSDLMAISEVLQSPVEFTHFLRWRLAITNVAGLSAGPDELNWLAIYLREGPKLLRVPAGFDRVTFTSYTDEFDAYFHYLGGFRTKPAERPTQPIPAPFRALLMAIETSGIQGFTAPAELLLNLASEERDKLAQELQKIGTRRDSPKSVMFEAAELRVQLFAGQCSAEELRSIFGNRPLDRRTTLLLSVDPSAELRVSGWLVLPAQG